MLGGFGLDVAAYAATQSKGKDSGSGDIELGIEQLREIFRQQVELPEEQLMASLEDSKGRDLAAKEVVALVWNNINNGIEEIFKKEYDRDWTGKLTKQEKPTIDKISEKIATIIIEELSDGDNSVVDLENKGGFFIAKEAHIRMLQVEIKPHVKDLFKVLEEEHDRHGNVSSKTKTKQKISDVAKIAAKVGVAISATTYATVMIGAIAGAAVAATLPISGIIIAAGIVIAGVAKLVSHFCRSKEQEVKKQIAKKVLEQVAELPGLGQITLVKDQTKKARLTNLQAKRQKKKGGEKIEMIRG